MGVRENKLLPALPGGLEGLGSARAAFAGLPTGLHNPPQVHTQASGHPESDANTTPHPRQGEHLPRGGVPSPRGEHFGAAPRELAGPWGLAQPFPLVHTPQLL